MGSLSKLGRSSISLLVVVLVALAWQRRRFARNVTYTKGVPLLGMLPRAMKALFEYRFHDFLLGMHQALGTQTLAANFGGICVVSTHDPKNLQHILKNNFDNYIKGVLSTDPFTDLLGDGIFNVDGEKWYHQRKTASRMFTKNIFDTHIATVVQSNVQKVQSLLNRSAGQQVDLFNIMNRFTLDTIGEIGFSRSIGSIEDPSSPFLQSFDYVQSALAKRLLTSQSFPTFKVLRLLGALWEKDMPHHLKLLNEYSNMVVDDLMKKVQQGDDTSFVGLFAKDDEGQSFWKRDEAGFRVYLRDMVLNFLLAGRDTTAQCLTWTFFELAQRPDAVAKIRQEVRDVCGEGPVGFKEWSLLQYTRAAVDEGLRLHPSVSLDGKLVVKDDVLPDGTFVPAGVRLMFLPYAQGRCTTIWGPDAGSFRPERWLEMERRPSPYEFVAFNAGPRECLGKRLAEMEMTTMVATLLRNFNVALAVPPEEVRYDIQITLGCSTGLPVTMTPLESH